MFLKTFRKIRELASSGDIAAHFGHTLHGPIF